MDIDSCGHKAAQLSIRNGELPDLHGLKGYWTSWEIKVDKRR